jgi:hypothetical protein
MFHSLAWLTYTHTQPQTSSTRRGTLYNVATLMKRDHDTMRLAEAPYMSDMGAWIVQDDE